MEVVGSLNWYNYIGKFFAICKIVQNMLILQLVISLMGIYKMYVCVWVSSVQLVTQSCPTLCDSMSCSTPGLPVHHQLQEFTQTHVHRVGDAIHPSHPLLSPSPPAPNPSQQQGLFQGVNSLHEVAKVLEFQLQHQSFHEWVCVNVMFKNICL